MTQSTTGRDSREVEAGPAPFAFFVGCGRSGTSLLRVMFDAHPSMNVPRDTYFILSLEPRRARYERDGKGFDVESFLVDLAGQYDFRKWPIELTDIGDDLRGNPPRDYPEAIRRIFALSARRSGKTRYGNKSPVHVRGLGKLSELFPEARFVHLIRDGRNVTLSYLDVTFGPTTIEGGALRWRSHVRSGRREGRRLGPERYREIRYERLIDDPEGTLREICEFLRVPFDDQMLRYHERPEQVYLGEQKPDHHSNLMKPPTKGMRDWRKEMSTEQISTWESISGGLLSELGYERSVPSPGLGVRLRAYGRVVGEQVKRGRRALKRKRAALDR